MRPEATQVRHKGLEGSCDSAAVAVNIGQAHRQKELRISAQTHCTRIRRLMKVTPSMCRHCCAVNYRVKKYCEIIAEKVVGHQL